MLNALLEFLLRGALLGATYGLLAMPIGLLFVTTGSVDLAIGAYAVLAAAVAMSAGGAAGVALGLAAAVAASLAVGLLSLRLGHGRARDPLAMILATFGVAAFLESLVLTRFGKDPMIGQTFDDYWQLGALRVSPQSAINLGIALIVLALLYLWLYRTAFGRDMRACAANALAAALAGIPVRRIALLTYLAGGLLAGLAGVLILYTTGTGYGDALHLTISGFGAALLFGLQSPLRGFAGGLAIGMVQALAAGYLPAGLSTAAPLLFILLVLAGGRMNVAAIAGGRA
ncbi:MULTISPECIES: iron chelate uptake ABC transporter family permease subunit [Cupriavidus]